MLCIRTDDRYLSCECESKGNKDRDSNRAAATQMTTVNQESVGEMVEKEVGPEATIYTDKSSVYNKLDNHETANHCGGEYVRGEAHVNGMESFWAVLKRAHTGTFHKISPKHLNRYGTEFAGEHNVRDLDTMAQMTALVAGLAGKRLMRRDLIADNGLSSGARA